MTSTHSRSLIANNSIESIQHTTSHLTSHHLSLLFTCLSVLFVSVLITSNLCSISGLAESPYCTILRTYADRVFLHEKHSDEEAQTLQIPCRHPTCLNEGAGARLVQEEVYHLNNILELVDGFGRPLGQVFDYKREYYRSVESYIGYGAVPERPHDKIKSSLLELISQAGFVHMEADVLSAGLNVLEKFRSESRSVGRELVNALHVLISINTIRNSDEGLRAKADQPRRYIQEVDGFVCDAVKNLTNQIYLQLQDALPLFRQASQEAEIARNMSVSLLSDLDRELVSVPETLRSLPWWDRYTLSHYLRRSKTAYFTKYLTFLRDNESRIRFFAEGAQIVADNLLTLIEYVSWYRSRQLHPLNINHLPSPMFIEDELVQLERTIAEFLLRAQTLFEFALIRDFSGPSAPPHRLGSLDDFAITISNS